MAEPAWLADQFERWRPHLASVAHGMLGSVTEAEDAVQQAWLRLARSDAITDGWLACAPPALAAQHLGRSRDTQFVWLQRFIPERTGFTAIPPRAAARGWADWWAPGRCGSLAAEQLQDVGPVVHSDSAARWG